MHENTVLYEPQHMKYITGQYILIERWIQIVTYRDITKALYRYGISIMTRWFESKDTSQHCLRNVQPVLAKVLKRPLYLVVMTVDWPISSLFFLTIVGIGVYRNGFPAAFIWTTCISESII